jgi:hypothetical protein
MHHTHSNPTREQVSGFCPHTLRQPRPKSNGLECTDTDVTYRTQGTVGNVAIGSAPPQGAVEVARWGSFSVSPSPPYVEPLQPVEAYDPPVSQLPSEKEAPQSSEHRTHSLSPSHSRSTPVRIDTAHAVRKTAAKHPTSSHKHSPHRKPSHPSRPAPNKLVGRSAAHAPAAPSAAVDHESHEEMEIDTSGTGGRPKSLMEAVERRLQFPAWGGMPPHMVGALPRTALIFPATHTSVAAQCLPQL